MKIFNIDEYIENQIKLNQDDEYYYSKDNAGLSASTLKKFHPKYKYKDDITGWKHPLDFGNAVHESVLEPHKYLQRTWIANNDKSGVEGLKMDDKANVERIYGAIMLNKDARSIITHKDAQFEVPSVKMHEGYLLKGKFDIVLGDTLYDIKTTSADSKSSFNYMSEQIFMYGLSNYHYYLLSGKPQHFIVVSKKTYEVWIEETDKSFYALGKRQWDEAFKEFKNK